MGELISETLAGNEYISEVMNEWICKNLVECVNTFVIVLTGE